MGVLELKFLGGLNIFLDGLPFLEIKTRKGQVLLCYLAVTHKRCSRSALAGLIWPDMPEANALMNLRKVLSRLMELRHYLTITRETVTFNWDAPHWLDVDEFITAAHQAYDVSRLQYAASLYQGDFLDGFSSEGSSLFDEWTLEKRVGLQETALNALQKLVKAFADRQDYQIAITYQRQLLTIDPLNEAGHMAKHTGRGTGNSS
jgi:DNA-binding SARP family transcriptional activator